MLDIKRAWSFLKIVPSFIIATAILGGLTTNVKAQVISSTFNTSFVTDRNASQDFFEDGRKMFEREINLLTMGGLEFSDSILTISEELKIQDNFSPEENHLQLLEESFRRATMKNK